MRLIDADALKFNRKIHRFIQIDRYTGAWPCILLADLCDACKVPTIDAEPVKYGRWGKVYRSKVTVTDGYVSTCCDMWNERKSRFCPNCGARMDEEGNT